MVIPWFSFILSLLKKSHTCSCRKNNRYRHYTYPWYMLSVLIALPCHATVLIRGNSTSPHTFTLPVLSKILDPATGMFYVGLPTGSGTFAISRIGRSIVSPVTPPKFTGIATTSLLGNAQISLLALATFQGNTKPFLVGSMGPLGTGKAVFASKSTGTQAIASSALLDASGALDENGLATEGTLAVAANYNFIFAAVKPSGGNFGQEDSGVAVVRINLAQPIINGTLSSLIQTAAVAGDMGIKAKRVDPTIEEVRTNIIQPTFAPNMVTLYWDDLLQRLYIGIELTSGLGATAGAKSVIVGSSDNGELNLVPIVPSSTLISGETDRVVAVRGSNESLLAFQLRVMHASTGTSYLIVQGGNGTSDTVCNQLYALPLVDNISTPLAHGTIADIDSVEIKDASLGTVRFTQPANTNAELPSSDDPAVRVGDGPFPLQAGHCISDLVVVGDTVFAASDIPQSNNNETGVFYSQAMFDAQGRIVRWTPWARRAFPLQGIPNELQSGRIKFFDVDAVTGNIYGIDDDTGRTVAITNWDNGSITNTLVTDLNTVLTEGSYAVLDLDQATRGLGVSSPSRYALFGGAAKIVFARTSIARAGPPFNKDANDIPRPQIVINDFQNPKNLLVTTIPGCSGCVTSLEFSRRTAAQGSTNYFFAGTSSGLFVFTSPVGNGFAISSFDALNEPPFSTGIWQKAPNIQGSIIDIKSGGQMLYVLVNQATGNNIYQTVLYKIPFKTSLAAMFAPSNLTIIAQTRAEPIFAATNIFTGIEIIKTGSLADVDGKEQLLLTTGTGVYRSNALQTGGLRGIIDATDQASADWQLVSATTTMTNGIAGINTPLPATAWPFTVADASKFNIDGRSTFLQINGSGNDAGTAATFAQIPTQFIATSSTVPFQTTPPISFFSSDGARRFFMVNNNQTVPATSQLMLLPINVQAWNIVGTSNPIISPFLTTQGTFQWISPIGATGIVMVGTSNGVIALE